MDTRTMQDKFVTQAAFGRPFRLGNLYDYRTDNVLSDDKMPWITYDLKSLTKIEEHYKLDFKCIDSDSDDSKVEQMGLDEHLQTSLAAGMIPKYKGAGQYLNDSCNNDRVVTKVITCRAESRDERLDWRMLAENFKQQTFAPEATHVVTGIVYGAQAYCVLSKALNSSDHKQSNRDDSNDDEDDDDDDKRKVEQYLSSIANKLTDALEDNTTMADFKEQFDRKEKLELGRLKCNLYADLQPQSIQKDLFDVYRSLSQMVDSIRKPTEGGKSKAIPITIRLCCVNSFVQGECKQPGRPYVIYRDIDDDIATRCCRIWIDLEVVNSNLDSLLNSAKKTSRPGIREFQKLLDNYRMLVHKRLKKSVVNARSCSDGDSDQHVETTLDIIEKHSIFKLSKLKRWLAYKRAEVALLQQLSSSSGISFLPKRSQVLKELDDCISKKFALVFNVPQLDERTTEILATMAKFLEDYTTLVQADDGSDDDESDSSGYDEEEDGMPWHLVPRKRKQLLDKLSKMSAHIHRNKHIEEQVHFLITLVDDDVKKKDGYIGEPYYSVYQGNVLAKDKLPHLVVPPTNLRIHYLTATKPSYRVEWDPLDVGYPHHHVVVEYRQKDDTEHSWKQQKTSEAGVTSLTINAPSETQLEFRVVSETCVGRSEYSEVVDTRFAITEEDCNVKEQPLANVDRRNIEDNDHLNENQRITIRQEMLPEKLLAEANDLLLSNGNSKQDGVRLECPTDLEIDWTTQTTVEVSWAPTPRDQSMVSYCVLYWLSDKDAKTATKFDVKSNQSSCSLTGLTPDRKYSIQVVAVGPLRDGKENRAPSRIIQVKTLTKESRIAMTLAKKCKKIGDKNGLALLAVPLIKMTPDQQKTSTERLVFGRNKTNNGNAKDGRAQHKTILVMGSTGSGKTTLINAMINYVFGVEWEDPFRFQLIQELVNGRLDVDSQTSAIKVYDIQHMEGFRVPYSLTIVDTPGYGDTKGLKRDEEITQMVREFFQDKNGIQEVDVVGFVTPASLPRLTPTQMYIFDSVLQIFGNDIKDNIDFLLTFADSQVPPVLSAIVDANLPCPKDAQTGHPMHHKFNNSGFTCSNKEPVQGASNSVHRFNRFFWRMGMENFQAFFNKLATMETKSLSLTKQVLEERKRLEATVDGLQPLIKSGLAKMEEMRKTQKAISNSEAQIEAHQNVEFEVEVMVPTQVDIPYGQYLTNCNKCHVTCHNPCAIPNDDGKVNCAAMDRSMPQATRCCRICPKNCIWNMHANQPYSWEYVKETKVSSSDDVKRKYETALNRKLSAKELIKAMEDDLEENEKAVLERVQTVAECIKKLDEIALRPNPFSTPQYIDLIIDAEQQDKKEGYAERVESLKKLRKMAIITEKVKTKESLGQSSDRQSFWNWFRNN